MSAPITSSTSVITAKAASQEPRKPLRKRRIVRRRGRKNGVGSEDEIERELVTDSESEDEASSLDSASDSDTEPASEDVLPNGHSRAFTPNTSQSSDRDLINKETSRVAESFFASTENWSEMVTAEVADGTADLPVIDFANFDEKGTVPAVRFRKSKKSSKGLRSVSAPVTRAPSSRSNEAEAFSQPEDEEMPRSKLRRSSKSPAYSRPPGQSARQAYQQRLDNDPSYVPTVGGFWGHDDRLLDKELRSLSGWWRGRWQGRGRGRGFMRGRGRGFFGSPRSYSNQEFDGKPDDASKNGQKVPAIDRKWTHDGFEEMKDKEERRRSQSTQQQSHNRQGSGNFRGGKTLNHSSRSGMGRMGHGRGRRTSSTRTTSGRIWYQMKPELMWTKQHSGYLHFDFEPNLKPRQGKGFGIQVKLPGQPAKVVRTSPRTWKTVSKGGMQKSSPVTGPSDLEEKMYAVRLPKFSEEFEQEANVKQDTALAEDLCNALPISDTLSLQKAQLSPTSPSMVPQPSALSNSSDSSLLAALVSQLQNSVESIPKPSSETEVTSVSDAVLKKPGHIEEGTGSPTLPDGDQMPPTRSVHQPTYTPPVTQPSPVYGSPYGYIPALPPGIAVNQHGVPYELATGRPVYIPPPPSAVYNPRPIMHSHLPSSSIHFVPGHSNHHSTVSPDFLSQTASHTPSMNGLMDPNTGTSIFSLPRQANRIKISAPSDGVFAKAFPKPPSSGNNSGLRDSAPSFEPSRSIAEPALNGSFPNLANPCTSTSPAYAPLDGVGESSNHPPREAMMTYQYPAQHYYYPEPYYNPYMDVVPVGQYDMFASEGYASQGPLYY